MLLKLLPRCYGVGGSAHVPKINFFRLLVYREYWVQGVQPATEEKHDEKVTMRFLDIHSQIAWHRGTGWDLCINVRCTVLVGLAKTSGIDKSKSISVVQKSVKDGPCVENTCRDASVSQWQRFHIGDELVVVICQCTGDTGYNLMTLINQQRSAIRRRDSQK